MKYVLALVLATVCGSSVLAISKVPECQAQPDFITQDRNFSSIKSLPHLAFVAKFANYYVENKSKAFRIWGEQSFVKGDSRIICASAAGAGSQSFSMYGPTLIDLSGEGSATNSYWQFHMMANDMQFGIWNQKSRLHSKTKDLESGLAKIGAQVQLFQVSHDEYEMILSRETDSVLEVLAIRFDSLTKLP